MLNKIKTEKILKIFIIIGFLALVFIIFSQKIEFTSLDLGRHLANGKFVWKNPQLLHINFYSYTETHFPFINHHWLSGVVFYAFYLIGGFKLLSFFNILLALSTFSLAFYLASKRAGFYLSGFLALPVIFLLSQRVNIRPEAFSYLFIILTWLIIERVARDKEYRRLNWLIPLFILWVNLHIYFFIGLALIAFKASAEFLSLFFKKTGTLKSRSLVAWQAAKPWLKSFIILTLACLLNPNTWRGLLYPFNILRNYGYQIAENKTIFYLGHLIINYNFTIFKVLLFLLVFSWGLDWFMTKKIRLFPTFLMLFFSGLGIFASRNISLFALIALVLISYNLKSLKSFLEKQTLWIKLRVSGFKRTYLASILLGLIIVSGAYLISNFSSQQNFIKSSFGWDLAKGSASSQEFFKNNNLSGPIFNNYNIGSALIFWLYPQERVFVDNRPEAYPVKFFKNIYKPLQRSPKAWKIINAKYHFKTIYFAYTDSTPWAQKFLAFILKDKNWSLVYFDRYSLILVNKRTTDSALVKRLSLSNSALRLRLRTLAKHSNLRAKFNLAFLAQELGQADLAKGIYQNILFNFPSNRQALVGLGSLYANSLDSVDLEAALTYFQRARQAGYRLAGIYDKSALVYWRLNNYQKAIRAWHSALKLNHQDISARYYLEQVKTLQSAGKLLLVK